MRTIVAACGDLGYSTLLSIYQVIDIKGILTDFSSTQIIGWAQKRSIPLFVGNPRKGNLASRVEELGDIDILISINYLFIFDKRLISLPKILPINIHGGKLPLYRGRAPHVRAIMNGEREIGVTLHQIDEGCDTGDIILQKTIELSNTITGGEVLSLLPKVYPEMIIEGLDMIQGNSFKLLSQEHQRATYYEKIKMEEREIDWNSSSVNICNLVRAVTSPYAGAFTFLNGQKIIIWRAEVDFGEVNSNAINGEILETIENSCKVKTADGAILITQYAFSENKRDGCLVVGRVMGMEGYDPRGKRSL